MSPLRSVSLCLTSVAFCLAQTPPCGHAILTVGGSAREERFLAATPQHVKACVLRALPVVAAKVSKDEDSRVEAKSDGNLLVSWQQRNKESGVGGGRRGTGASGTFSIEINPGAENGTPGTRLAIEFRKNAFKGHVGSAAQATPLMEEVSCLATILSPSDPVANPRGAVVALQAETHEAVLPEGTPIKLLLRDYLYSKQIKKDQPITLEVAEDVVVDGVTLVRRGALGTAKFTDARAGRSHGRAAVLGFEINGVTAVDGQFLAVTGAVEKSRGAQKETKFARVMTGTGPILGLLDVGVETVIRAGTGYDVETTGKSTIRGVR